MTPELQEAVTQYLAAQPMLRDQFAMAALIGLIAKPEEPDECFVHTMRAITAYQYADAMLKARKVQP